VDVYLKAIAFQQKQGLLRIFVPAATLDDLQDLVVGVLQAQLHSGDPILSESGDLLGIDAVGPGLGGDANHSHVTRLVEFHFLSQRERFPVNEVDVCSILQISYELLLVFDRIVAPSTS